MDKEIAARIPAILPLDILILRGNPEIDVATLVRIFSPGQIVLDASNSRSNSRKWKLEAEELGVPCHSGVEDGAVVVEGVVAR